MRPMNNPEKTIMGKNSEPPDAKSGFQHIVKAWPGNTSYEQRQRLLETIQKRGSVTTMEAVRFLEIVDPRPRISELRAEGWHIVRSWTMQESETGGLHRVGLYRLTSMGHGSSPITYGHTPVPKMGQASLFDVLP
ncbi:helix-turn-helix domain-containing protein [Herbaspirillum sp. VT-16-41]|uniref:helix-turn-helix domain-containing protein n=1 Tax=Herbaspirillum sp. VT-16-41 TaxID=1953765 RepID=UPI0027B9E483|nr:helix-turn-helix domain-containing protein [Herbaspirillum sp. VT-16-41]